MLGTLIKKDLARLRVNWRGMLVLLAMPLCITGLVGTVFGPAARSGELPRIKLAIVNEDDNIVGGMLTGIASSEQTQAYLDPVVTDRTEAMRLINSNKISAVLIVPANFSSEFLAGKPAPPFELIKNPAQSYMPAITEELFRVVTELLNAVSLNLMSEVPELVVVFEDSEAPNFAKLTKAISHVGDRFERAEDYLFPPIIGLNQSNPDTEQVDATENSNESKAGNSSTKFNIFAIVMPGLVAVFMLFTAEGATRDLFAEKRNRTLDRFRTFSVSFLPFLLAKSVYSLIVVLLSAFIMMAGGSLIFDIAWKQPFALTCLTISYSTFCVGFAYFLVAVIYREQLASVLNTVVIMLIGFLGGSMMPTQALPSFLRNTISPWMPNYLFAEAAKTLQLDFDGPHWTVASIQLLLTGVAMLLIATILFQRRLQASVA